MNRLVLIDGHGILYRAYHALPPLTTSKGELVNAVFGFTSMLLRVISDLKPTHIAVAFDRPEPTFRNKLFKDYQIQRPKADEEMLSQIDLVKKVITEIGIPIYEKAGYEADDVIGTIANQVKGIQRHPERSEGSRRDSSPRRDVGLQNDIEVVIVTGDRDILQLVDERIKVYMPVKGLSESKLYGEKEVKEKFGIDPSQIVDYKALIGDPSDNYPGVSGIGPKTAASLLARFKTLEDLYKHLDKVESEKAKEALKVNRGSAELAKKLAMIVKDAPIEFGIEKCRLPNLDRPDVRYLFEELEFRSLIPRLGVNTKLQRSKDTKKNKKEKMNKNNIQQTVLF